MSLQQAVKEGVEVVQGEAGVHPPVALPGHGPGGLVDIIILRPGQGFRILTVKMLWIDEINIMR